MTNLVPCDPRVRVFLLPVSLPVRSRFYSRFQVQLSRTPTPGEALFVTCDQSTMTPEDIEAGHLICVVGLASVKPAEFVRYRIDIRLKTP